MSDDPLRSTDVLIVGAGPTGLVLAIWLTRLGVRVQIIARSRGPGTASRALVVHARTLELYEPLGLAQAAVAAGKQAAAMNLWAGGQQRAHLTLGDAGAGLSPYPFFLVFSQEEHEQLLVQRLRALGVDVHWGCELIGFADHGTHVTGFVRDSSGVDHSCEANYLAGCDGAHSLVREGLGLEFSGGTYPHTFFVADIEGTGTPLNGEGHVYASRAEVLLILPMAGSQRARLVGMADSTQGTTEAEQLEALSRLAARSMQLAVEKVNWFSTYQIHHRVAASFRRGRVFLAGDAGHIHSPVGGQGMNTGIGDAINLAWKLAAVLHGQAGEALLDSYDEERLPFARLLVNTTDRVFTLVTSRGPLAEFLRAQVLPLLLPVVGRYLRAPLFRTVSQIQIQYRRSSLSQGTAGRVCGGDRLPWVSTANNFQSLNSLTWQAHVYGAAHGTTGELTAWLGARGIPLHLFPWSREAGAAGLARGALYLLRPDGYVAVADPHPSTRTLEHYLTAHGIRPAQEAGAPLC